MPYWTVWMQAETEWSEKTWKKSWNRCNSVKISWNYLPDHGDFRNNLHWVGQGQAKVGTLTTGKNGKKFREIVEKFVKWDHFVILTWFRQSSNIIILSTVDSICWKYKKISWNRQSGVFREKIISRKKLFTWRISGCIFTTWTRASFSGIVWPLRT